MKTMNEYKDQELQWLHPNKFKGIYELRGGEEVFARFHLKGTCGSQIVAETANGNWIIQRKGISQSITILDLDSQSELANIKRSMSGQSTLTPLMVVSTGGVVQVSGAMSGPGLTTRTHLFST